MDFNFESACNDIFNYCKRFIYRCKKNFDYPLKSREIQSPYISFPFAHSSHLFNSQIHFPTLVRGKFLSSQTPSSTRSLPYFSRPTSHGVSRPWANPLANAKTTLYPPPPRCLTPAFIFLEFASRDSSRLFSSGGKFSSL